MNRTGLIYGLRFSSSTYLGSWLLANATIIVKYAGRFVNLESYEEAGVNPMGTMK